MTSHLGSLYFNKSKDGLWAFTVLGHSICYLVIHVLIVFGFQIVHQNSVLEPRKDVEQDPRIHAVSGGFKIQLKGSQHRGEDCGHCREHGSDVKRCLARILALPKLDCETTQTQDVQNVNTRPQDTSVFRSPSCASAMLDCSFSN